MKLKLTVLIATGCLWAGIAHGETITAQSQPFSFPALTGTQHGVAMRSVPALGYRLTGAAATLQIHWTLPEKSSDATIMIYTLSGKQVARFSLDDAQGSITWQAGRLGVGNGMYLATLRSGSFHKSMQMLVCK